MLERDRWDLERGLVTVVSLREGASSSIVPFRDRVREEPGTVKKKQIRIRNGRGFVPES